MSNISVKKNCWDSKNFEKPYEGSRRGRGMPSAMEPLDSFSEQGRAKYDEIFTPHGCNNQKITATCMKECEYNAAKHENNCILYSEISDCTGEPEQKKVKIEIPKITEKLTGMGIYDGD